MFTKKSNGSSADSLEKDMLESTTREEPEGSRFKNAIGLAKHLLIEEDEEETQGIHWEVLHREIVSEVENQLYIYTQLEDSCDTELLKSIVSVITVKLKDLSILLSQIKDSDFQDQLGKSSSQSLPSSPQKSSSSLQGSPRWNLYDSPNDEVRQRAKSTSYATIQSTTQRTPPSLSRSLSDLQYSLDSFMSSRTTQPAAYASQSNLRVTTLIPRHARTDSSSGRYHRLQRPSRTILEHVIEITLAYHIVIHACILQDNVLLKKISDLAQSEPSTPPVAPLSLTSNTSRCPPENERRKIQYQFLKSNLEASISLLMTRLSALKQIAAKGTFLLAAFQDNQGILEALQKLIEQQSKQKDFISKIYMGFLKRLNKHVQRAVSQKLDDLKEAEQLELQTFNSTCASMSNHWREVEFQDKQRDFIRLKTEMSIKELCKTLNVNREHLFLKKGGLNVGGNFYEHILKNAPKLLGPLEIDEALAKLTSSLEELTDGEILSKSCYGQDGFKVMNLEIFTIDALIKSIVSREYNEDLTQFLSWFYSIHLQLPTSDTHEPDLTFILKPSSSKSDFSNHVVNELHRKLSLIDDTEKKEIYDYFMTTIYPLRLDLLLAHHLQNIHGRLQYLVNSGVHFLTSISGFDKTAIIALADGYAEASKSVREGIQVLNIFIDAEKIEFNPELLQELSKTKRILDLSIDKPPQEAIEITARASRRSSLSKTSLRES